MMHPSRASLRRAGARAFTLMEVMVVIVLLGLLAGATATAVFGHLNKGRERVSRIGARLLRDAAGAWRSEHPDCPTPTQLREERYVDRGASLEDAWGTPYAIVCEAEDVTVVSAGPDKQPNTPDDLREPPS
jgi:prepilin-type N-terminal cleavage/methylation domain-containing protein